MLQKIYSVVAISKVVVSGTRLMVEVPENASASTMKEAICMKQALFNPHLIPSNGATSLLYKSMDPVQSIPGSTEDFTLRRYKDAVGLPWSQITLVLNYGELRCFRKLF